jgi:cytochrome c6
MKKICILASAILLAAAPILILAAEDGAALFGQKCSMCHGEKGEGNKDAGMPAARGTAMTAEKLATFLLKGDSEKAIHANPMGSLNEEQAKAVADFVKSLK